MGFDEGPVAVNWAGNGRDKHHQMMLPVGAEIAEIPGIASVAAKSTAKEPTSGAKWNTICPTTQKCKRSTFFVSLGRVQST